MTAIEGTVLLTGASGGIGHAIARALAARGAKLVLTGRRADVLEPLARELGGRALALDLADRDAVERARRGGRRGRRSSSPTPRCRRAGTLDDFTIEEIDRALDVNLRAPIVLAKLLSEPMARARPRPPRLHLLAVGQGGLRRAARSTRRRSSACAASRCALREDLRAVRRRRLDDLPRLHPRRRHVRQRAASSCRAASARARPRTSRAGGRARDRAQPRGGRRRAARRCASARRSPGSRPALSARRQPPHGRRARSPSGSPPAAAAASR